jgi:hypothetical protein
VTRAARKRALERACEFVWKRIGLRQLVCESRGDVVAVTFINRRNRVRYYTGQGTRPSEPGDHFKYSYNDADMMIKTFIYVNDAVTACTRGRFYIQSIISSKIAGAAACTGPAAKPKIQNFNTPLPSPRLKHPTPSGNLLSALRPSLPGENDLGDEGRDFFFCSEHQSG